MELSILKKINFGSLLKTPISDPPSQKKVNYTRDAVDDDDDDDDVDLGSWTKSPL